MIMVAYIILKYHWTLNNALQYCTICFPDLSIKQHFLRQLRSFSQRHSLPERNIFDPNFDFSKSYDMDPEELILRNTVRRRENS